MLSDCIYSLSVTNCTVLSADTESDATCQATVYVPPSDVSDSETIRNVTTHDQDGPIGGQMTSQLAQVQTSDSIGLIAAVSGSVIVLLGILIVFVVIVLLVTKR